MKKLKKVRFSNREKIVKTLSEKRINRLQKAVEREEMEEKFRHEMLVKRRSNVRQPSWLVVQPIRIK